MNRLNEKRCRKRALLLSLCGVLVLAAIGVLLVMKGESWTGHLRSTGGDQSPDRSSVGREPMESQRSGARLDGKDAGQDDLGLPSPFEDMQLSPYKKGSLVYAVDAYVRDEGERVKQLKQEAFRDTLLKMSDWNSNYYKLVIQDAEPSPSHPSSLQLIIYSRRFAKLVGHGHGGLTPEQRAMITHLLRSDLSRWRTLWSEGQRIRAPITLFHSVNKASDKLIAPLTFRINSAILLVGACSLRESLPAVLESVEVLGEDTNWAAVGYACDKILTSTQVEGLGAERRRILGEYQDWKAKEGAGILEYETTELPSFDSLRRPFERATSLGAAVDFSTGKTLIEIPPQHTYITLRGGKGYYDPTGSSAVLKKVVAFAKAYSGAAP